jgi:multidrug efflux pump subunit AcrA (membrane-fusion protein)
MDTKTGTFAVVAEFPNPAGQLRPGLFGRVRGSAEAVENATLIGILLIFLLTYAVFIPVLRALR